VPEAKVRWQPEQVLERLRALADPESLAGMARYGLGVKNAYGVRLPLLRALAKEIGRDHALAERLWATHVREPMVLATLLADPKRTDEALMDRWVLDITDWEVCDQCCMNLFERVPQAYTQALAWGARGEEFVKRAGFVLMARLAAGQKKQPTAYVLPFVAAIEREACDERNMVKKAISWALRDVGKRDLESYALAVQTAGALRAMDCRAARWVAADVLADITRETVLARLHKTAVARREE
jgi:3-methyladenine DNA glycosylase AlkD